MTASSDIDVDFVVREVVRRLRQAEEVGAVERPRKNPPTPLDPRDDGRLQDPKGAVKPNKVTLSQRVVTLDALPEDWDGVSCIQVTRGAVITPSVRDELRQRGVALHFTEAGTPTATMLGLGIAGERASGQNAFEQRTCDALAASLDVHVQPQMCGTLPEVVADLTHCVRRKRLAVLLTEQPHLAVCMLNRQPEVRAICVDRPEAVGQAVDQTAANVMVIDSGNLHIDRLIQLVRPFARGGWQACPDHLRRLTG